jgi:hypothetical protein
MITVFCAYLLLHFLVYALWARRTPQLKKERYIFLYHVASFIAVALAGIVAWLSAPSAATVSVLVLMISIHGIYSLSFLELWSLAQGGYALTILSEVARAEASGGAPDLTALGGVGAGKQEGRLSGLQRLGLLVASANGEYSLSGFGRLVAMAIAAVRRVANIRNMG